MSTAPVSMNGASPVSRSSRPKSRNYSRSHSGSRGHSKDRSPRTAKNVSREHSRNYSRSRSREPSYYSRDRSRDKSRGRSTRSRSRTPDRKYKRSSRYSGSPRSPRDNKRSRKYSKSPSYSRDRRSTSRRRSDGGREDPRPNRCLGVFGLSLYTTERQIHHIFNKYGTIDKVQVVLDAKTGRSRGFAFVYYEYVEDATDAKNSCSGMEIDGRRIRADYSITERPHTPTPGIYMGRPTYTYGSRGGGGGSSRYRDGGSFGYSGGRRRSPSPYHGSSRRRSYRSRSKSYSPRRNRY